MHRYSYKLLSLCFPAYLAFRNAVAMMHSRVMLYLHLDSSFIQNISWQATRIIMKEKTGILQHNIEEIINTNVSCEHSKINIMCD